MRSCLKSCFGFFCGIEQKEEETHLIGTPQDVKHICHVGSGNTNNKDHSEQLQKIAAELDKLKGPAAT